MCSYKAHRPDTTDIIEAKAASSKHDMLLSLIRHIDPADYANPEQVKEAKDILMVCPLALAPHFQLPSHSYYY